MSALSLILCEGYADRAFIAEFLERRRGCQNAASDVLSLGFERNVWGFRSQNNRTVALAAVGGIPDFYRKAELFVRTKRQLVDRVLVVVDHDGKKDKTFDVREREVLARLASATDPQSAIGTDGSLDLHACRTRAGVWMAGSPDDGIASEKEILERLISAAIIAALPVRATAVANFLAARPDPLADPDKGKHHAHVYGATWKTESFGDDFYREVWRDEPMSQELERRMIETGIARRLDEVL